MLLDHHRVGEREPLPGPSADALGGEWRRPPQSAGVRSDRARGIAARGLMLPRVVA